jgi:hypothetical protein
MAKIRLGNRPETFKSVPVTFVMPDGSEGAITATFRYRTREEYGQYIENAIKGTTEEGKPAEKVDFGALYRSGAQKDGQNLLDALHGWDLDEPLNSENVFALANEIPAACAALSVAYRAACVEGRLGNS